MTPRPRSAQGAEERTPCAVDIRHAGVTLVLLTAVVGTIVCRSDLTHVLVVWFAALLYLAFCIGPVSRVLKTARVTWPFATIFLGTTLCCVGFGCCLPADADGGRSSFSLASRAFGVDDLSAGARGAFLTATWLCFLGLAVGTLALWYAVLRLARRSEWAAIDHSVGIGRQ